MEEEEEEEVEVGTYVLEEAKFLPLAAFLRIVAVLVQSNKGRETKVGDLEVAVRSVALQKNVLELEVSVHHAERVQVVDAQEDLPHVAGSHHFVVVVRVRQELMNISAIHELQTIIRRKTRTGRNT